MDVPPTAKPQPGMANPASLPFLWWNNNTVPTTSTYAGPVTTGMGNIYGPRPDRINWVTHFDPRRFCESKPQWHRVAKPATQLIGRRRQTVMKSLRSIPSLPSRRVPVSRPIDKHYADKENETSKPKRARLTETGVQGFTVLMEGQSAAEAAHDFMRAKAQIVNHIALHPDSVFDYDGRDLKLGGLTTIVRQKRRVDSSHAAGAKLAFYQDLLSLVVAAWENNGLETECTDLVEHMHSLEGTRRDPRAFLAAIGRTDLTAIADVTEPDSAQHDAPAAPSTPAAWSSSARRKARLSGYIARRQSNSGDVAITPQRRPNILSSPLKTSENANTTATPVADGQTTEYAPNGPTRRFEVSSFTDSTLSTNEHELENMSAEPIPEQTENSPIRRPGAPTPSRWTRKDPSTPAQSAARQAETPHTPGGLGLMASLPADMAESQPTPPSWNKWDNVTMRKNEVFQFSGASFEDTQASDHYSVFGSKADRRRSEPLLQHLLRDQARRFSESPQKFFAGADQFGGTAVGAPSTPVRPQRSSMGAIESARVGNDSDFASPMPAYFRPSWIKETSETPAAKGGVYNIDMRQNPDIFGMQSSQDSPQDRAVIELAKMAEQKCDGGAKVVTLEENGKLIVRFKLPTKYAYMFPANQGADESRFTFTPSAISSSPRIGFVGHEQQQPSPLKKQMQPEGETTVNDESSSLSTLDHTPTLSGFQELKRVSPSKSPRKASSKSPAPKTILEPPSSAHSRKDRTSPFKRQLTQDTPTSAAPADRTLVMDFDLVQDYDQTAQSADKSDIDALDTSSILETPTQQLQREHQEAPSSGLISDVSFEPTFQTPTFGHLDFSPAKGDKTTPTGTSNKATPAGKTPTRKTPKSSGSTRKKQGQSTPEVVANLAQSTPSKTTSEPLKSPSPPLNTSFTPVNKRTTPQKPDTPKSAQASAKKPATPEAATTEVTAQADTGKAAKDTYDFDSPGRDFMYEFIRKSRPKKPSATETGSPLATPAARQPLGAKSPNAGSPSPGKVKRKHNAVAEEKEATAEPTKDEPAAKKARRTAKTTETKKLTKIRTTTESTEDAERPVANTKEDDDAPRRSTRLRHAPPEAKSSIPTPIKLRGHGAGRTNSSGQPLNSAIRSEQAELSRTTSMNTRRNRGNAESVQQILARVSEELSGESADELADPQEKETLKRGKTVSWRDPIESFQQTPKPKSKTKVKPTAAATPAKSKPTQGSTGVSKQKATPKAAPKSSKISQAAKTLGMAGNGTPAKRATRARTRSQA